MASIKRKQTSDQSLGGDIDREHPLAEIRAIHAPVVGMDGAGNGFVVWWQETRAELWVSVYEPE